MSKAWSALALNQTQNAARETGDFESLRIRPVAWYAQGDDIPTAEFADWVEQFLNGPGTVEDRADRAYRIAVVFRSFDYKIAPDVLRDLRASMKETKGTDQAKASSPDDLKKLKSVKAGRVGETVLAALAVQNDQPLSETDPELTERIIKNLRLAGLENEAKAYGMEVIAAALLN